MNRFEPRTVIFADHPEFTPNLSPKEIFEQGAFGGTYFRKIHSGVTGLDYQDQWKEFESFVEIGEREGLRLFDSNVCNVALNKYKVKAGSSLADWEKSGWIVAQDPYGWVQWYCRFYYGRRSEDDARQIDRWLKYTGPKGRWKKNLVNKIKAANASYDDVKISPVIRQGLHQWGYCIVPDDLQ